MCDATGSCNSNAVEVIMRAEKEMGGCRCRRRWRWEKRPRAYRSGGDKGPSTPVVLALFLYIYISCVVKRTETSYLKMGGARELDHWMDHLVLGQEAFSLLLASSHCIIILLAMCFCIIDLSAGSSHAPSDPVSLFMIHPSITH